MINYECVESIPLLSFLVFCDGLVTSQSPLLPTIHKPQL